MKTIQNKTTNHPSGYSLTGLLLVIICIIFLNGCKQKGSLLESFKGIEKPKRSVSNPDTVLTIKQQLDLIEYNDKISKEKKISLVSLIVRNSKTTDFKKDFVDEAFKKWSIGKEAKDRGILIAIDAENQEIAVTRGEGLKNVLKDSDCENIMEVMKPYCKQGDYESALTLASKLISEGPDMWLKYLPEKESSKFIESIKISTDKVVDLGLSVNWAGYNIGAETPDQFGNLFRYGDPFDRIYQEDDDYMPKENIIGSELDAATINWGEGWRTPSKQEAEELMRKCLFIDTKYKGIRGAKIVGPSKRAIFLPYAGIMYNYGRSQAGSVGEYQLGECINSINYYTNEPWSNAYELELFIDTFAPFIDIGTSKWGRPVRAVKIKNSINQNR